MKQERLHRRALTILCWTIFLLLAFPRMNIRIGPIPLYIIDLLLLATFYYSTQLERIRPKKNLVSVVGVVFFLIVFSEVYGAIINKSLFEPIYLVARTALAYSLILSVRKIIRTNEDLAKLLKFALPAISITALLLILSSLPQTKGFIRANIFSINFLEPASAEITGKTEKWVGAERGSSLIGVSILSGAFVNSIFPLLLLLRTTALSKIRKFVLFSVTIILPASVIFTYSRGAIIGTILVILAILMFNSGNYRSTLIVGIGLGLAVFLYVGVDSQYFYFKRLEQSTVRVMEQPIEDRNETERLYAYIEPFWHMREYPHYVLFGEGIVFPQSAASSAVIEGNRADHAVFARAYYAYGMVAALLYVFILISSLITTLNFAVLSRKRHITNISRVLFASLFGFLPWFVFGHAAVSEPRGAALWILILALVSIQDTLKPQAQLDFILKDSP